MGWLARAKRKVISSRMGWTVWVQRPLRGPQSVRHLDRVCATARASTSERQASRTPPALAVCPLPLRAFHVDPPTARSAGVTRLAPLRHDALEPETVAVVEQDLAVFEHLDLVEIGHPRAAAELIVSCSDLRVSVRQPPSHQPLRVVGATFSSAWEPSPAELEILKPATGGVRCHLSTLRFQPSLAWLHSSGRKSCSTAAGNSQRENDPSHPRRWGGPVSRGPHLSRHQTCGRLTVFDGQPAVILTEEPSDPQ